MITALCLVLAMAALDTSDWAWHSPLAIEPGTEGFVRLPLTPEMMDACLPSLDDLRVVDEHKELTPFLIHRDPGPVPAAVATLTGPARDKENRCSSYDIDLGFRHMPVTHLRVGVTDPLFYRSYELLGRNETETETQSRTETGVTRTKQEAPWHSIVSGGVLYRRKDGEDIWEWLAIADVRAPYRYLRLKIKDGDSPPIDISEVAVFRREISVVFNRQSNRTYTLLGGNPKARAPEFDLARFEPQIGDTTLPVTQAGALIRSEKPAPPLAPWTERHGVLLWAAILAAAALVAGLILKNMASLREDPSEDS